MYLDYYQLREYPFTLASDPRFLYFSDGHKEAMAGLGTREKRARDHLEAAIKQMGRFATPTVLLASLREHFPASKIRAKMAPKGPSQTQVQAVLDVLDSDGVTATQILNELRKSGDPEVARLDSDQLARITRSLRQDGKLAMVGEGRGKRYRLESGDIR